MIKFQKDYQIGWWQSWASARGPEYEYARLRGLGWRACDAWRTAKIRERFAKLEAEGKVQLLCEPECDYYDDSWCDPEELKITHARIESEGCWVLSSAAVGPEGREEPCDSVGGFIGEDWRDSNYDDDIMLAACELAELAPCVPPTGPVCAGRAP